MNFFIIQNDYRYSQYKNRFYPIISDISYLYNRYFPIQTLFNPIITIN
ncbi:hypothetical protein BACINT_00947 [Bacteroides intestinalis DSM 17393]|uniref:Uncharacterized protein n=1 Tax=Bacteroides intestinalis DSM 17393 TaxID=471870 RepID=B3C8Y4_9BACE|nr:hypothetical protein BACINT_00947 [Bacteroides intestinalis DSM 17393]